MACACGLEPDTDSCCGRFVTGGELPETAEQLMRSRYTAYTMEQIDYIVASHEPDSRDEVDEESATKWAKQAKWHGLEIVSTEAGKKEDDTGVVEFIARYTLEEGDYNHHERATFRKIDDRWYYVDGDMVKRKPVVRDTPKVGRNEPCPCGSGRKFKKCCGTN